jgi:hypothetical protein
MRQLSEAQSRFASNLKEDLLSFCRLDKVPLPGRGIQGLWEHISHVKKCMYDLNNTHDLDQLRKSALDVVSDRVAMPGSAATCDPLDHLHEPYRSIFAELNKTVAPSGPTLPCNIKACHKIDE